MKHSESIKRLRTDHEIVGAFLGFFEAYCRRIDRGEAPPIPPAEVLDFIESFIERFHHVREEQVLFQHLMRRTLSDRVMARRLVHDHDDSRHHIEGMQRVLDMSSPDRRTAFAWNGLGYAQIMREHVGIEEHETYPLVESMLTETDEQVLAERFRAISPDEEAAWAAGHDFLARATDSIEDESSSNEA